MKKILPLLLACGIAFTALGQQSLRFYIGSLTPGPTSLITLCALDSKTGTIARLDTFNHCKGPGYLAISANKRYLYAATQSNEIKSFSIDRQGKLTYLNSQSSEGLNPCYVSVHPTGKLAFLANYTGGSVTALPIGADGQVKPASSTDQYMGSGPNKPRQDKAHAHCALASANGKYLYVTDLGTDRIVNYRVDVQTGKLAPNPAQAFFSSRPGVGPRHMVVHPSGNRLFVVNELTATLTALAIDKNGVLSEIQTVATLPTTFSKPNTAAAIRLHPNGKFLYVSNRGYNGITAFQINADGTLQQVDTETQAISTPRDFNIDPTGNYLIVANMDTDNLTVYRLNPSTGQLTFQAESLQVSKPTCIVFF